MNRRPDRVLRARSEPILLAEHDPSWSLLFEEERTRLRRLLPESAIGRIEHIGSTAVPGLVAKPIVDLMVESPDYETVRQVIAPILEAENYDFFWRPVSRGDAEIDYAWFIRRDPNGKRTHHVHFAPAGSSLWDRVTFRDFLRSNPEEAEKYGEIKRQAVSKNLNRAEYAAAKGAYINDALTRAKG